MRRFVNFVHCSLSHAIVVPLLHLLRTILNRKLRRHHGGLVIVELGEHGLVRLIILFLGLILLLHVVDFKMLAVVEELTIVIIVCAVTLAHVLTRTVVLASNFVAHLVYVFAVFGLICIARLHVFSFLKSFRRVVVFLSSTNGVFDRR